MKLLRSWTLEEAANFFWSLLLYETTVIKEVFLIQVLSFNGSSFEAVANLKKIVGKKESEKKKYKSLLLFFFLFQSFILVRLLLEWFSKSSGCGTSKKRSNKIS